MKKCHLSRYDIDIAGSCTESYETKLAFYTMNFSMPPLMWKLRESALWLLGFTISCVEITTSHKRIKFVWYLVKLKHLSFTYSSPHTCQTSAVGEFFIICPLAYLIAPRNYTVWHMLNNKLSSSSGKMLPAKLFVIYGFILFLLINSPSLFSENFRAKNPHKFWDARTYSHTNTSRAFNFFLNIGM